MIIHSDLSAVSQKSNLVIFTCNHIDCSWIMWQLYIYVCVCVQIVCALVDSGHWLTTKLHCQGMSILCTGCLPGTAVAGNK